MTKIIQYTKRLKNVFIIKLAEVLKTLRILLIFVIICIGGLISIPPGWEGHRHGEFYNKNCTPLDLLSRSTCEKKVYHHSIMLKFLGYTCRCELS